MTPFEATLLSDSVSDLTRTLHGNRALDLQERGLNQRDTLAREELKQRGQERTDLSAHRATVEQIQRESKELQDRHYKMMEASGLLQSLQKGIADGTIKPEALKATLADNPLLKSLGLGVDLFQAAPEIGEPQVWEDKASGRRFGYRKGSKELHDLTPNMGSVTEEIDETTGKPKRKITRKLNPDDLESAMRGAGIGGGHPAESTGDPVKDARLARIDREMKALTDAIAGGDESSGLFGLGEGNAAKVKRLQGERAQVLGTGGPAAPTSTGKPAGVYSRDAGGKLIMSGAADSGGAAPPAASQPSIGTGLDEAMRQLGISAGGGTTSANTVSGVSAPSSPVTREQISQQIATMGAQVNDARNGLSREQRSALLDRILALQAKLKTMP